MPSLSTIKYFAFIIHSNPITLPTPARRRKRRTEAEGKRNPAAMDFWNKAMSFAEDAAKRSSELTKEAVTRSQDLAIGSSRLGDIVSRSKELAAEASKRADQIKVEAIKRADQIKSIAIESSSGAISIPESIVGAPKEKDDKDLERFGVTDELREFVRGINVTTFQDFPLPSEVSNCYALFHDALMKFIGYLGLK